MYPSDRGLTSARLLPLLATEWRALAGLRAVLLAAVLTATASAQTVILSFDGFGSTTGLTINGSARTASTADGQVLRLVPASPSQAGSAFTTAQVNVTGFSTAFDFRLSNPGPSSTTDPAGQYGADGLTFAIQTVGNSALGALGIGLGYQGIGQSTGHSLAVEFDTWLNSGIDPTSGNGGSNHLGIDLNGSISSLTTAAVSPNFDNGTIWTAWIDYNGTNLEVRVSNTGVRPASATLSQAVNLSSTLGTGTAFIGFTAGTGSDYANHDILNWAYSDTFVPGGISPVPEPATYQLMLIGAGLLWLRRRRLRPAR